MSSIRGSLVSIVVRSEAFAKRTMGERLLGSLEYLRQPHLRSGRWGGPFNGQEKRAELFWAIINSVRPKAIVETGAHLGVTTELMASAGPPVFSIESQDRYYGYTRMRLWRQRNAFPIHADSREGLRRLFDGRLRAMLQEPLFFYLDAHWNADLPLAEELQLIFERCSRSAIMIDDFEVPGDAGYTFDNYGPGARLDLDYVASALVAHDFKAFFPAAPSEAESGSRRGCVVLAPSSWAANPLQELEALRPHQLSR